MRSFTGVVARRRRHPPPVPLTTYWQDMELPKPDNHVAADAARDLPFQNQTPETRFGAATK